MIPNQDELITPEPIEHFLQMVVSLARHVTATDRRWWWPSETLCSDRSILEFSKTFCVGPMYDSMYVLTDLTIVHGIVM